MRYEVSQAGFSGPLDALLDLVERKKLDVSDLSLGAVTEDFLRYVAEIARTPEPHPVPLVHAIADFLTVATRLLLLKSRTLLPGDVMDEADVEDPAILAEQLRTYQAVKPALLAFRAAYLARQPLLARTYLQGQRPAGERAIYAPPAKLGIGALHEAAGRALHLASQAAKEIGEVRHRVISLQKAISQLVHRLGKEGRLRFSELCAGASRGDTIVLFLATLHLARDQRIGISQEGPFSDIVLEHGRA